MKCFIYIISVFMLLSASVAAVDISHEFEYEFTAFGSDEHSNSLTIRNEFSEYIRDDLYAEARTFLYKDEDVDEIRFDRFYLEGFRNKLKMTLGRQRVYWGMSQVFNFTDVFNTIDVTDPDKERPGADAVRILYNPDYFSRIEFAYEIDDGNDPFAFRYSVYRNGWEYMINYLKHGRIIESEDIVLEWKGDIGVGFWGQMIWSDSVVDSEVLVMGFDYSWLVQDRTLVAMTEFTRQLDTGYDLYYYSLNYNLSDFSSLTIQMMNRELSQRQYAGLIYSHFIDDYRTLDIGYNRYYSINPILTPGVTQQKEVIISFTMNI